MKKLVITVIAILFSNVLFSQIKAITETGDEVILYKNGSWVYVDGSKAEAKELAVNKTKFKKDDLSTFLVKSNKINIGIWINPKEWSFSKEGNNEDSEYTFQKRDNDLYALFISEKISIPLESLKDIAVENAKKAAPDARIIFEEMRNVNGNNVLMLKISATIQGIKILYTGYYYSNTNGTIQLITYTSDNLAAAYTTDIETFLNGLTELQ